ncbi:MAG TPA: YeeE/YedE thiosulfate transporter family protein, partial [Candidatus Methanoperedens sp.]|nr:YeeE/YedE thiosulfate transporter family protein [Candidatus Methanoperedens sp.]
PSAVAGAALLRRWGRRESSRVASAPAGHLRPRMAALALSALTVASALVVGLPLGVTSSYAKIGAWLERLALPAHFEGLALFKTVPLSYRHPLTGAALTGGPGPQFDAIAAIQFPLVGGIVLGAALSALLLGEWRLGRGVPRRQLASGFAGGLAMGLASRMAPTCNVWHLLGGLPMLAASSFLFLAGLLPGAWIGGRLLTTVVLPGTTPPPRRGG